ncbi:RNA-binding protein S4 [Paenibacillus beijingensis]|uniref:RNA-binding protein S4 n=2 Tax=Paenibacillus beijingensis TaxID=1126833 RepID=A0A0D5NHN1_9BACL|nr:RNA-binding protein S4 [Paenibacillus beijingensis]
MKPISIKTEYITLGQFLKLSDCIDSGGQAKMFLQEYAVTVNGEPDNRRGRKLYDGDKVNVEGFGTFQVQRG